MAKAQHQAPSLSGEQLGELLGLLKGADTVELKLTVPESDQRSAAAALELDVLDAQIRQVEALVNACASLAQEAGATTVALGVMEDNLRGRRAYVRLGFGLTGARRHVHDGRDELIMAKSLLASSPSSSSSD